jgi:hypothetical protein
LILGITVFSTVWTSSALALTFGSSGSGDGQLALAEHSGLAVNESTHDIYVADTVNHRVVQFDAAGLFVRAWGADVGGAGTLVCSSGCTAGTAGAAPGAFEVPVFIAVDNSSGPSAGDVYVADTSAKIISKFEGDGTLVSSWGVNGQLNGAGATGVFEGPFETIAGIAIGADGNLNVFEQERHALFQFEPDGTFITNFETPRGSVSAGLAVDPLGNFFKVNGAPNIEKFDPSGSDIGQVSVAEPSSGLAVDAVRGDLYVGIGQSVDLYTFGPLGEVEGSGCVPAPFEGCAPTDSFGKGSLSSTAGVAVDASSHTAYVADSSTSQVISFIAALLADATTGEASSIVQTTATVRGSVVPGSVELDDCVFEYGETTAYGATVPCAETPTEIGTGGTPRSVHADLAGLIPGTQYHFRLAVSNEGGSTRGDDKAFRTVSQPVIVSESIKSVSATEVVLNALITPGGTPATFHIDFGTDLSYGQSSGERNVGADYSTHSLNVGLAGLSPNTIYHWRVVASNAFGTVEGLDRTFSTYGLTSADQGCENQVFRFGAGARLPDCRAYEMVSPVEKNNTDIASLINVQSIIASLNQSSVDGEKITYTTSQGFGDAQGASYLSQYLASRGADGWHNHGLTPPQGVSVLASTLRVDIEFRAFTPDLCSAALRHDTDSVLAPGAAEGFSNVYVRNNCGLEDYWAATNTVPPFTVLPEVQGFSRDGRCVAFYARTPLTADAAPSGVRQIYESCGGPLRLINKLPNGETFEGPSSVGTSTFGDPGIRTATTARAVSADGSRVYWTADQEYPNALYVRDNAGQAQSAVEGGSCTEPTKACTIAVSPGPAQFWSASPDGSKAFYSEIIELTGREIKDGELYEFDLDTGTSSLVAESAGGVIGASEDATRISFVSPEVLTPEANSEGDVAIAGEANLYLFDSTLSGIRRYRLIGTLLTADARTETGAAGKPTPVNLAPFQKTSRVSPDGRQIAFMSTASLTGYDNTDAVNGEADAEVYAYDATAAGGQGRLRCVSCNPSGRRPVGREVRVEGFFSGLWAAAFLPTYQTELYGSRVISDNGQRVYFNSYEGLLPGDSNGKADVYQWEAPGSGTCTEGGASFSPLNQGCLSLISSGESPSDSEFVDASPDGRDVFFATDSSLVPQDPGLIDIYDAREGGGFSPPTDRPAACEGEACQSPPPSPGDSTPASATFNGPGNLRAGKKARCPKGKVRRKGSCVRKKGRSAKSKRGAKRANHDRRTTR